MKPPANFTARLRQAARRRLSRFTNTGQARALTEVSEAREARFDSSMAGLHPPRLPRFVAAPPSLAEHELAVPAAMLDAGLPEPAAMKQVAEAARGLQGLLPAYRELSTLAAQKAYSGGGLPPPSGYALALRRPQGDAATGT